MGFFRLGWGRFNIVHTSPDINFDRIAYLTKLVFSTKIVVVALVTEEKEWYKMECECFVSTYRQKKDGIANWG